MGIPLYDRIQRGRHIAPTYRAFLENSLYDDLAETAAKKGKVLNVQKQITGRFVPSKRPLPAIDSG